MNPAPPGAPPAPHPTPATPATAAADPAEAAGSALAAVTAHRRSAAATPAGVPATPGRGYPRPPRRAMRGIRALVAFASLCGLLGWYVAAAIAAAEPTGPAAPAAAAPIVAAPLVTAAAHTSTSPATPPASPTPRPGPGPAPDPGPDPVQPDPVQPDPAQPGGGSAPTGSVPNPGAGDPAPGGMAPGGTAPGGTGPGTDPGGIFDVAGQAARAITEFFASFVTGGLVPLTGVVGPMLDPSHLMGLDRVQQLWGASLVIANSLVVVFIVIGGLTVMSHETLQTRWAAKEIAPRLVIGAVAANLSWWLVREATGLSLGLAQALAGQSMSPGEILSGLLVQTATGGPVFLILLTVTIVVMTAILALALLVLAVLSTLLIAAAPLALVTHALPHTEWIAHLWWRAMLAALAVPVVHGLVLALVQRVLLTPGGFSLLGVATGGSLVTTLVTIALLYVMIKVPFWSLGTIRSLNPLTPPRGGRRSLLRTVAGGLVAAKTFGLLGGTAAAGAGGGGGLGAVFGRGPLGTVTRALGAWPRHTATTPRGATPGRGNPPGAGLGGPLAGPPGARGRVRRACGIGPASFLAPPPAEPTRYRAHRAPLGHTPAPASFLEPRTHPSTTASTTASPNASTGPPDSVRRTSSAGPGAAGLTPTFRAPTQARPGGAAGAATVGGPGRAATVFSHPPAPQAPARPRPSTPSAGGPAVFLRPPTTARPATSPGGSVAGSGVRGYHSTATPVTFSAPTSESGVQYRPERLGPAHPAPPAITPPRPSTGVERPRGARRAVNPAVPKPTPPTQPKDSAKTAGKATGREPRRHGGGGS